MEDIGKVRIHVPEVIHQGDLIEIKALIHHPMETGLRKDKQTGQTIPAHYINEVTVTFQDELVLSTDWGPAISQNPYISFFLKVDGPGQIKITWKDNQGGIFMETANKILKP